MVYPSLAQETVVDRLALREEIRQMLLKAGVPNVCSDSIASRA